MSYPTRAELDGIMLVSHVAYCVDHLRAYKFKPVRVRVSVRAMAIVVRAMGLSLDGDLSGCMLAGLPAVVDDDLEEGAFTVEVDPLARGEMPT